MDDPQIIELYWARSEQAISETAAKYGTFLWRIARNILESHDDADECVNDTYLRAWNAIPPSRPSAFRAWAGPHHPQPLPGPVEPVPSAKTGRQLHGCAAG